MGSFLQFFINGTTLISNYGLIAIADLVLIFRPTGLPNRVDLEKV